MFRKIPRYLRFKCLSCKMERQHVRENNAWRCLYCGQIVALKLYNQNFAEDDCQNTK
ncbi:hypothetical protein ACFL2O_10760 [Thermodesulfobacteriota bacterium]